MDVWLINALEIQFRVATSGYNTFALAIHIGRTIIYLVEDAPYSAVRLKLLELGEKKNLSEVFCAGSEMVELMNRDWTPTTPVVEPDNSKKPKTSLQEKDEASLRSFVIIDD